MVIIETKLRFCVHVNEGNGENKKVDELEKRKLDYCVKLWKALRSGQTNRVITDKNSFYETGPLNKKNLLQN